MEDPTFKRGCLKWNDPTCYDVDDMGFLGSRAPEAHRGYRQMNLTTLEPNHTVTGQASQAVNQY